MSNIETYAELEQQRRHLVNETDPKSREMIMSGINRMLDSLLDSSVEPIAQTHYESSEEGQAHLNRGRE